MSITRRNQAPRGLTGEGCDFAMVATVTLEPGGTDTRYKARVRRGIVTRQLGELAEAEATTPA